jgi:putative endonuclease
MTFDVQQRIKKHNSGDGAKYTRSRRPVVLVRTEMYSTETEARKREAQIKGWPRIKKENLVRFDHQDRMDEKG